MHSNRQYNPALNEKTIIDAYIRYYEQALEIRDLALVIKFEDAVTDFGQVIMRCNARFGSDFIEYQRTESNELLVSSLIDEAALERFTPERFPFVVSRPSEIRASSVLDSALEIRPERLYYAQTLYEEMIGERAL